MINCIDESRLSTSFKPFFLKQERVDPPFTSDLLNTCLKANFYTNLKDEDDEDDQLDENDNGDDDEDEDVAKNSQAKIENSYDEEENLDATSSNINNANFEQQASRENSFIKKMSLNNHLQRQNSQIQNSENQLFNKSQSPLYFTYQSQPLSLSQYLKNAENVHVNDSDLATIDQHQQKNVKTKVNTTNNKNQSFTHLNNIFHIFDMNNSNQLNLFNNLQTTSHQCDDKKDYKNNTNNNDASRCQSLKYNKNDTSLLAKQINLNSLANMMMLRQQQQLQQQLQQQEQKNIQINANTFKNTLKLPKQSDLISSPSLSPSEINGAHLFYQNCISRFLQLKNKTNNINSLKSIPFLSSPTPITDNHDTDQVSSSLVNHFGKTTTIKKNKIKIPSTCHQSNALNDDPISNGFTPVKNYLHNTSSSSLASPEFYHSSLQPTIVGNTDHFQFLPYKKRKFDTSDELSSSSSSTLSSRSHYNTDNFLFDNQTPPEYERIKKIKRCPHVWQFCSDLLDNENYNPSIIKWLNKEKGIFKIVKPDQVATLWGAQKNRKTDKKMNYEKMARGMRYSRREGFFKKLDKEKNKPNEYGKQLVFQFSEKVVKNIDWKWSFSI